MKHIKLFEEFTVNEDSKFSTKKLALGHYTGSYNGVNFTITKAELPRNEVAWY
jgi:hypothetical protein